MSIYGAADLPVLKALGDLIFTNPFTPERLQLEEIILKKKRPGNVWNMHNATSEDISEIAGLAEYHAEQLSARLNGVLVSRADCAVIEPVMIYHLFEKYRIPMVEQMMATPHSIRFDCYRDFENDFRRFLGFTRRAGECAYEPAKTFAIFFQIHRAFYYIFDFIIGSSIAAGELRATVWQSIFTCDIHRWQRVMFDRMNQITTLIQGESGTGKELVAKAVAYSQYIPFDPSTREFLADYTTCFIPLQLSAMPQAMLESELFGHRKGAYTGALEDRKGYLESCSPCGSVFLDEIGEINPETQVKLLRVLQSRHFQAMGDNRQRTFNGKIIAATNRDLVNECAAGNFREDLYYRLCADTITTIPLRELTGGDPTELERFVNILASRILGAAESTVFTAEAMRIIAVSPGLDYHWPGNVRELEQCVRNLLIRGRYVPNIRRGSEAEMNFGNMNMQELMQCYCRSLYRRFASYQAAAEFAGLDRRTIAKYCDEKVKTRKIQ
ncbi:MAG: sigma 54-interacting transcriptional regulator [Victivallaceae bacterium]|nr:sigma 54-interacting transcriptional regulator [Victivallaceae bacterium]MDD4318298.1 sigma 54-interacting transcriptional regulator [Victivallaceae bacterium]MDD5663952.1 sigma 54-interacting transcriptional regulator [Victivallaceae bacterium]NLK83082.1 sigma 54-interacting transcriptional regulator [Lentisphaerota bacterium]